MKTGNPQLPHLYVIPKDSLPNQSMPIDFTEFDKRFILSLPVYIRKGLCLAKTCRLKYSKKHPEFEENYLIDSYFLKTCLLRIMYKNRFKKFLKTLDGNSATQIKEASLFWAMEIFNELESIFSSENVNFERFHEMLARKIAGKELPGFRKLFVCPSSH